MSRMWQRDSERRRIRLSNPFPSGARRFRNRPRTSLIMRFTRQYQVMAVPRAQRAAAIITKWLVRQAWAQEAAARSEKNYLVSFIGYAPLIQPQVLCYVVVDTRICRASSRHIRLCQRDFQQDHGGSPSIRMYSRRRRGTGSRDQSFPARKKAL